MANLKNLLGKYILSEQEEAIKKCQSEGFCQSCYLHLTR